MDEIKILESAAARNPGFHAGLSKHGRVEGEWILVEKSKYSEIYRDTHSPQKQGLRLGDLVAKVATPIARALGMPCIDQATGQLRPESGCAKRKAWLNGEAAGIDIYAHGGLGDVFLDLFESGHYDHLDRLPPSAKARVIFFSSNPFAAELFAWHPHKARIETLSCPRWEGSHQDDECAKTLGVAVPKMNRRAMPTIPLGGLPLKFYPSPADLGFLEELRTVAAGRAIVMLAPGAGELMRNIPASILAEIVNLAGRMPSPGVFLVQAGRNYVRGARQEPRLTPGCYDAIDRLSVPGTARLLQLSAGLVTAHSSLNILGWFLRKPQLLLAPKAVFEQHLARPSRWGFGIRYPETIACRFEEFRDHYLGRFAALAHSAEKEKQVDEIWS